VFDMRSVVDNLLEDDNFEVVHQQNMTIWAHNIGTVCVDIQLTVRINTHTHTHTDVCWNV